MDYDQTNALSYYLPASKENSYRPRGVKSGAGGVGEGAACQHHVMLARLAAVLRPQAQGHVQLAVRRLQTVCHTNRKRLSLTSYKEENGFRVEKIYSYPLLERFLSVLTWFSFSQIKFQ
jgi:hypothetical protein